MSVKGLFSDFRDYLTMKPEDAVRDFIGEFDWKLIERHVAANSLPVAQNLRNAVDHSSGAEQRLLKSLYENENKLHWKQSYTAADFGQVFIDNYGFVEMFGTRGHFQSSEMAGGLFVMGPMQHYPSHYHVAEELYIPLTNGSYWMRSGGSFEERSAGEVIVHESNEAHAMETPDAPLIALYIWRNGDLAQKSNY